MIEADREVMLGGNIPRISTVKDVRIRERGKTRVITPIVIKDRVCQKVLCDYSLTPIMLDSLIYDNGASLPGKGVDFARARMHLHMCEAIRKFGDKFYALTFDFKSYYDSIPHYSCRNVLSKIYREAVMVDMIMKVIKSYHEVRIKPVKDTNKRAKLKRKLDSDMSVGICLGSQVSQMLALLVPNDLDHYIKDVCGVRHYIRYMDDGVLLAGSKDELRTILGGMKDVCKRLGLVLHEKKTRIVKVTRGFVFLKRKYSVCGRKLIVRLVHGGIVRMRRKLRKFARLVGCGKMSLDDVYNSFQSWVAHTNGTMSYKTMKSMMRLYNELFGSYRLTKKYKHIAKEVDGNGILQADKWAKYRWCCDVA